MKRMIVSLLVGGSLILPAAFAQSENGYRSDVTVQAIGSFVQATDEGGVRQSATHSGGVLGTYRMYFHRNHGVEFNYGYSLNTQKYEFSGSTATVKAYGNEATAAYVLRFPTRNFVPFALAGGGALVFDPKNSLELQARPVFVYGAGVDWNFSSRVFMRAQYRGQVYNSPDFGVSALNSAERVTHRAQPSVGFGFRF